MFIVSPHGGAGSTFTFYALFMLIVFHLNPINFQPPLDKDRLTSWTDFSNAPDTEIGFL